MKNNFVFLFLLLICQYGYGQSSIKARIQIGEKKCTTIPFFEKESKLDSVLIAYEGQVPISINTFFLNDKREKMEDFYFLKFLGDLYLLNLKFGAFDIPVVPKVNLALQPFKADLRNVKQRYDIDALFTKDSVRYDLSLIEFENDDDLNDFSRDAATAHYRSGDNQLKLDFTAFLSKIEINNKLIEGSAYLIQGMVDLDGSLKQIEPVISDEAGLTDSIIAWLAASGKVWHPASQGGRNVKSLMDVFIQVKDNTLEISTCGYNRKRKTENRFPRIL